MAPPEAGHPPVHFAVSNTRIISLAEFKLKGGVGNRVEQPCQQTPVIGQHITIVKRHRVGLAAGVGKTNAIPDIAALAGSVGASPLSSSSA